MNGWLIQMLCIYIKIKDIQGVSDYDWCQYMFDFVSIYMYVHKAAILKYQANNVHLFFGKVVIRIACKGWARKAQATS